VFDEAPYFWLPRNLTKQERAASGMSSFREQLIAGCDLPVTD
jgi:hypothetical protein